MTDSRLYDKGVVFIVEKIKNGEPLEPKEIEYVSERLKKSAQPTHDDGSNTLDALDCVVDETPTIDAVPVVRCRECRITQDERERIVSWLGKFCRHIDNFDISLNDYENTEFFKEKMFQQFGWEKTLNCGARMEADDA